MAHPILVEISAGELIDKITQLEVQATRISDPDLRSEVVEQLGYLERVQREACDAVLAPGADRARLAALRTELRRTNDLLGRLRNELQTHEDSLDFGPSFVERARGVQRESEMRHALMRRIDALVRTHEERMPEQSTHEGV